MHIDKHTYYVLSYANRSLDMRTTLDLPTILITEAQAISGAKTKTQAIICALTEMVARRKSRQILTLKGSLAHDYDYKSSRRKR